MDVDKNIDKKNIAAKLQVDIDTIKLREELQKHEDDESNTVEETNEKKTDRQTKEEDETVSSKRNSTLAVNEEKDRGEKSYEYEKTKTHQIKKNNNDIHNMTMKELEEVINEYKEKDNENMTMEAEEEIHGGNIVSSKKAISESKKNTEKEVDNMTSDKNDSEIKETTELNDDIMLKAKEDSYEDHDINIDGRKEEMDHNADEYEMHRLLIKAEKDFRDVINEDHSSTIENQKNLINSLKEEIEGLKDKLKEPPKEQDVKRLKMKTADDFYEEVAKTNLKNLELLETIENYENKMNQMVEDEKNMKREIKQYQESSKRLEESIIKKKRN